MEKYDSLDQQALQAAKETMGSFAWPTVVLGVVVIVAYLASFILAITGLMPLLIAAPTMALMTYAAYTVLHEAVHGTISGSHTSLRWLNDALGYIAAWILMIPLTAHRHEHLAHHRHTNKKGEDPDFVLSQMMASPLRAVVALKDILLGQYKYYFTHRWSKAPRSQNLRLVVEVFAAVVPRLAVFGMGFWVEGLLLLGAAWFVGVALLMFLFAYIVHAPHDSQGRYLDTSTILVQGLTGKVMTALWLYQNYHSIHHLFPRVPFYRYRALFDEIEDTMVARGAPIYRLGLRGLEPQLLMTA